MQLLGIVQVWLGQFVLAWWVASSRLHSRLAAPCSTKVIELFLDRSLRLFCPAARPRHRDAMPVHLMLPTICTALLALSQPAQAAPAGQAPDPRLKRLQATPYKIEVATADGAKLLLTDALTLERRKLLDKPGLAAVAFSPGGEWLYAVANDGEVLAVEPDKAKVVTVGRVLVRPGEFIVDAVGLGPADQWALQVLVASAAQQPKAGCALWKMPHRIVMRRGIGASAPATTEVKDGWPDDQRGPRLAAVSPNTRYRAQVVGPVVQAEGRFGAASGQLSRTPLPSNVFALEWMHDSAGLGVLSAKRADGACAARVGLRVLRDDTGKKAGWDEWTLPDSVDLVRGDQPGQNPNLLVDGMRWLGVEARGVVLIEPLPRFRGKLALVAPPSVAWPKVRPGIRPQASISGGNLRLVELMMETGDLDSAEDELAAIGAASRPAEVAKLKARLAKLTDVRARRAPELRLTLDDLRSQRGRATSPTAPPPDADAVEQAAPVTPTQP